MFIAAAHPLNLLKVLTRPSLNMIEGRWKAQKKSISLGFNPSFKIRLFFDKVSFSFVEPLRPLNPLFLKEFCIFCNEYTF